MILFATLPAVGVALAWRGGDYGTAGGIAAFAIVCFSSYPLQFPEFIATVGLMLCGAVVCIPRWKPLLKVVVYILFAVAAAAGCRFHTRNRELAKEEQQLRHSLQKKLDEQDIPKFDSLVDIHGGSARLLFDYGKALRDGGLYEKSTAILSRGMDVSSDPMFLNLIGRNHHDLGQYGLAEHYFNRSIDRLPGRMYPYYLLARLYADPAVGDSARFMEVCDKIFAMEPKVMSPAIRQMRSELESLRDTGFVQNRK